MGVILPPYTRAGPVTHSTCVLSHSSCVCLFVTLWTVAYQALLSMGILQARIWSGLPFPPPGDLPNPGIEPGFPALQVDSLSAEPPGKPKNTRGGSLSLLQVIFVTLELNRGLLHCRQILYQLSYQGSPRIPLLSPQIVHTVYLGQRLASFF